MNSIFTVTLLREKGYNIGISEFIGAKNLGEILDKMLHCSELHVIAEENEWIRTCPHFDMEAIPLQLHHKNIVTELDKRQVNVS